MVAVPAARFGALLALALAAVASIARGQESPPEKTTAPPAAKTGKGESAAQASSDNGLATPRATLRTFLQAVSNDDLAQAAECLNLSQLSKATADSKATSYAWKLKGVIDRLWYVDYAQVPNQSDATEPYVLAQGIGTLSGPQRQTAARISLAKDAEGQWKFSPQTVAAVDELWNQWRNRPPVDGVEPPATPPVDVWLAEKFPSDLRRVRFLLADYQWLCILALIFIGFVADRVTRFALGKMTIGWARYWSAVEALETDPKLWRPMGLLAQALVWYWGVSVLGLPAFVLQILLVVLKLLAVAAAVWTAFRLTDFLAQFLAKKASKTNTRFDDLLVPLVSKSLKVFATVMGAIVLAEAFDLPIAGLLGGLGIGGLALAMASKDAVSNLFGSLTVLVDRPFEIGDWIITSSIEGSVEAVGFRSTRIRTFYNSQITLPNSLLTTAVVDNMGRRRYRRIKTTLCLQYDTTPEQIDAFCEGVRELIRRHPYTRKDYYHVYFNDFGDSSLDVLLYCFLECPDWAIELRERHRLLADILRLAATLQVSFAFPTRTLHLYQEEPGEGPPQIGDVASSGRARAARIAGPLLGPQDRPGDVLFEGPSNLADDGPAGEQGEGT